MHDLETQRTKIMHRPTLPTDAVSPNGRNLTRLGEVQAFDRRHADVLAVRRTERERRLGRTHLAG